jgi:site-specific recombinase XerD
MKNNDFAKHLTSFFTDYLACERGVSPNTIRSYSNTFMLLLDYMDEIKHVKAENVATGHLKRDVVVNFLNWLQERKQCKDSTRNQRLAAIHAFCKYMQYEDVIHLEQWQSILSIKIKKTVRRSVNFLTIEGIKLLLSQIPSSTRTGYRDLAMLALLYDSGARVQELIDLRPVDLHLSSPCYVTLFGKGRKKRLVPLQKRQVEILNKYITGYNLEMPSANQQPLFQNAHGRKLTCAGVTYILSQYAAKARIMDSELIPERISPHSLRHSKAMHMLQAGINLVYIRDILGHVSIQTTEIYARADSKQKREALEAAYVDILPGEDEKTTWEKDAELKMWLKNLGR